MNGQRRSAADAGQSPPLGFWSFFVAGALTMIIGLVYVLRTELLPYHLDVLDTDWHSLPPRHQLMFRSLLNGAGGATLATGAALLAITLVPLRRGEPWARWVLLMVGLLAAAPTTVVVFRVLLTTEATPPWPLVALLDLLLIAGFMLSKPGSRSTAPMKRRDGSKASTHAG